jgi:flagellin-like protein
MEVRRTRLGLKMGAVFGPETEERAISPLIATLILILVTIIGGGVVFSTMRSQASSLGSSAELQLQSVDIVSAGGVNRASVVVKNTGTVALSGVAVEITTDGNPVTIPLGDMKPGDTKAGEDTSGTWTAGKTYVVTLYDASNTVRRITTAVCHC